MLRIGAVARNIREFNRGHLLDKFPEIVGRLRSTLERFMEVPSCIDRGFIGDEMLECIPSPARVARSIVGGIDRQTAPAARRTGSHRPVGPPNGFAAAALAAQARELGNPSPSAHGPRHGGHIGWRVFTPSTGP